MRPFQTARLFSFEGRRETGTRSMGRKKSPPPRTIGDVGWQRQTCQTFFDFATDEIRLFVRSVGKRRIEWSKLAPDEMCFFFVAQTISFLQTSFLLYSLGNCVSQTKSDFFSSGIFFFCSGPVDPSFVQIAVCVPSWRRGFLRKVLKYLQTGAAQALEEGDTKNRT
jgi:hypothetical protein